MPAHARARLPSIAAEAGRHDFMVTDCRASLLATERFSCRDGSSRSEAPRAPMPSSLSTFPRSAADAADAMRAIYRAMMILYIIFAMTTPSGRQKGSIFSPIPLIYNKYMEILYAHRRQESCRFKRLKCAIINDASSQDVTTITSCI